MLARARRSAPLALLAALCGCQQVVVGNDDDDRGDDDGPRRDIPLWSEADDGDPFDTETGEDDGPAKLDMLGDPTIAECSVVDLLFVIDNSDSMTGEQASLIASFDGFIAGIQANLGEINDYHIGVVTTDAYVHNQPGCQELGALVTATPGGVCGPWSEGRFISLADDLASGFTCAAAVGGGGDNDEHQIEAALRAISPELDGPGACNQGFVRDEALLVLVVITDEDDGAIFNQGTPGEPDDWVEEIVARKGVESNVVVLALAGVSPPNACNNADPDNGAQIAYRIEDFVEQFSYGRMGDVCADNYAGFFAGSLEIIHDACVNFTPEG